MRIINTMSGMTSLLLGRLGENERTQFVFDVSEWLEEYPNATIAMYNQLPHSSESYPVVISQPEDGKVTWTVGATELQEEGYGQCELVALQGETVVKGHIWKTRILTALDGAGDAPDPWESWMTEFTALKGEAEDAAEAAEAWATGGSSGTPSATNNAKYYSEQSEGSAEDAEAWAIGQRGGVDVGSTDPTYHNNSKYYSGLAEHALDQALLDAAAAVTAAETAQGKAEDAQTAAEIAQGKAEDAQEAAETAQGKAEDAQEAAEDAQEAAEAAQGLAEDAQEAAEAAQGLAEDAQEAAETAQGKAEDAQEAAEAWATGGTSGTPSATNNAKYYSEQAASSATAAASIIDDTAGDGDTTKTWSADKLVVEFAEKYEKPSGGIPSTDLASAVQTSLGKADSAYQKPIGGIPSTDLASAVQTSLGKADSAYQKPSGGIPSTDLASAVQTSLGKAESAYQKPSGGIPGTDLADDYIEEPSSEGTNGQVLTTDGNGGRSWTTVTTDVSGKADKVSNATSGNFAGLDSNGNLTDSGHKHSDYLTSHQDITGKADKSDTVLNTTLSRGRQANTTVGTGSVAFGDHETASGDYAQAFGYHTQASGDYASAEGRQTTAGGKASHAEGGWTYANGDYSHADGMGTIAEGRAQHVFGIYNKSDFSDAAEWDPETQYEVGDKVVVTETYPSGTYRNIYKALSQNIGKDPSEYYEIWEIVTQHAEIVGCGSSDFPANIRTLDWEGNEELAGDLKIYAGTANEVSVSGLNTAIARINHGKKILSNDIKQAFINLFNHLVFTDEHGQDYVDDLVDAWTPDMTTLTSIDAVFTQGQAEITEDNTLDDLKQYLTVNGTFAYSGGTYTDTIMDYTLSGTLEVGTSTITVTVGSLTDTFDVTVTGTQRYIQKTKLFVTDKSYIDTPFSESDLDGCYFEYKVKTGPYSNNSGGHILSTSNNFLAFIKGNTSKIVLAKLKGTEKNASFAWDSDTEYVVTAYADQNNSVSVNGNTLINSITAGSQTPSSSTYYRLFRNNPSSSNIYNFVGTFYYMKIYSTNNTLIHHLVPAVDSETEKAGLYDLITENFYSSSTSTEFTAE